MSGIALSELNASDLLDVLHFFFEEDAVATPELLSSRSRMRTSLFQNLYERPYKYAAIDHSVEVTPENQFDYESEDLGADMEGVKPFNPRGGGDNISPGHETKPFIPPTRMDPSASKPFGNLLDAPLS